ERDEVHPVEEPVQRHDPQCCTRGAASDEVAGAGHQLSGGGAHVRPGLPDPGPVAARSSGPSWSLPSRSASAEAPSKSTAATTSTTPSRIGPGGSTRPRANPIPAPTTA